MQTNSEQTTNQSFIAKAGEIFGKVRDTIVDDKCMGMALFAGTVLPLAFHAKDIVQALQQNSAFALGVGTGVFVAGAVYSGLLLSKMSSKEDEALKQSGSKSALEAFRKSDGYANAGKEADVSQANNATPNSAPRL